MEFNNIEELIKKYENAETTLQEEAQLSAYFNGNTVAPHLEHYQPLFQFFAQATEEQFDKDVPLIPKAFGTKKKTNIYRWISVAAIAIIMSTITFQSIDFGPTEEERIALENLEKAKEALQLISLALNKGQEQLNHVSLVSENLNLGLNEASRINEFSKTTNQLLKSN